MVDIIGKARVIVESYVDEAAAKVAGKKTGDAAAKGAEESADDGAKGFSQSFSKSLTEFGPALAGGAGGAIAAALVGGVIENMDREATSARLVASLGLGTKEIATLTKTASKIYADNWGDSFEEVQKGVAATISSFGKLDGKELLKAAENAQQFADIFEVDVVQAAAVAGIAVKNGLAKDATEAFDLMTKAAQQVPIQFRDELTDAITEYSGFFRTIGIDGPQAFGLLVSATQLGQYGIDKVGDAIKEFSIRATDSTTAVAAAFKQLGLSKDLKQLQTDLAAGGKAGKDAFDTIVTALNNIKDPLEQRQAALALFGTPLEDLSQTQLPEFIGALADGTQGLKDFDGAAKNAGETAGGSQKGSIATRLRQLKEELLTALNDPDYTGVFNKDVGLNKGFTEMLDNMGESISTFFSDAGTDFSNGFVDLAGDVNTGVNNLGTNFSEGWVAIKTDVKTEFNSIKATIKEKVDGWVSSATTAISKLPGKMKKAGSDAIQGFIDGLSDVGGSIGRSAGRIAKQFKDAINRALPDSLTFFGGKGGIPAITVKLPQLRTGARNFAGGLALVGEEGPELVHLPRGSDVYTADQTAAMGSSVVQNNTYIFQGSESFAQARADADWSAKHGTRFGSATRAVKAS